jgi:putative transposase
MNAPKHPVHLRGYGFIKVFRTVDPRSNADYWTITRLIMTSVDRKVYADRAWLTEDYHPSIKQLTGIQAGQFSLEVSQCNHIGSAIRALYVSNFTTFQRMLLKV